MTTTLDATPRASGRISRYAPFVITLPFLFWSYWPTLVELVGTWHHNPQYQHGFLVPLFACWLLYLRRDRLKVEDIRPNAWGLMALAVVLAFRLVGAFGFYVSVDSISLVPCIAALVFLLGGWAVWRWAWPAILFLFFMIPLPYFASVAMAGTLQRIATIVSTFALQTMGLPALSEGNVILLNEHQIGIVEACSGLRMLVVFFALATAVVLVTNRHWVDRIIIIISAVPIAMIANILRIIATGLLYDLGQSEWANHFFHDVAGWMMMPVALGMLWVELQVLSALFIDSPAKQKSVPVARQRSVVRSGIPRSRRPATSRSVSTETQTAEEVANTK